MLSPALGCALLRKFKAFGPWNEAERLVLDKLSARRRHLEPHQTVLHEHDVVSDIFLIQSGWTVIYKVQPDGNRQVLSFPLPGDIVGLNNIALDGSVFCFEILTHAEVSPIAPSVLGRALAETRIARAIYWSFARDAAILMEHLVNLGTRSALVRTAHLLLEFAERLDLIGVDTHEGFDCPLNQHLLADALGMTAIHLNRILRQLREANLLVLRNNRVTILDRHALAELAAMDTCYLDPPVERLALNSTSHFI